MRFLGPSTSSRARSCGSRYRLSPSLNLFASTYHELEDNNLAAYFLRYVHILRICSFLARSSCGNLTRPLYVCTYFYIRLCPAGISEGFLVALRMSMCLHPRFSCGTCGAKCSRLLCKYLSRISGHNFELLTTCCMMSIFKGLVVTFRVLRTAFYTPTFHVYILVYSRFSWADFGGIFCCLAYIHVPTSAFSCGICGAKCSCLPDFSSTSSQVPFTNWWHNV